MSDSFADKPSVMVHSKAQADIILDALIGHLTSGKGSTDGAEVQGYDFSTALDEIWVVARSLNTVADEESLTERKERLLRTLKDCIRAVILKTEQDSTHHRIADICHRHPRLLESVLQDLTLELIRSVQIQNPSEVGARKEEVSLTHIALSPGNEVSSAIRYLQWLKVLLWSFPQAMSALDASTISCLLDLFRCSDQGLVEASRRVLCSVLSNDQNPAVSDHLETRIWTCLRDSVLCSGHHFQVDNAFILWLNWVSLLPSMGPSRNTLQDPEYWTCLRNGLRTGLSERRRQVLHILLSSQSRLESDVDESPVCDAPRHNVTTNEAWSKYATLFEMIILNRAVAQIPHVLPELRSLLHPQSEVPQDWAIILFEAALDHTMQENVRHAVGDSLLDLNNKEALEQMAFCTLFLQNSFLPYVTNGDLFTMSLREQSCHAVSVHGERLAAFICRLTESASSGDQKTLVHSILSWIYYQNDRLFVPAQMYTLIGLHDGLRDAKSSLDKPCFEWLVKIGSRRALTTLEVEFLVLLSLRLIQYVDVRGVGKSGLDQLVRMLEGYEGLVTKECLSTFARELHRTSNTSLNDLQRRGSDSGSEGVEQAENAENPGEVRSAALRVASLLLASHVGEAHKICQESGDKMHLFALLTSYGDGEYIGDILRCSSLQQCLVSAFEEFDIWGCHQDESHFLCRILDNLSKPLLAVIQPALEGLARQALHALHLSPSGSSHSTPVSLRESKHLSSQIEVLATAANSMHGPKLRDLFQELPISLLLTKLRELCQTSHVSRNASRENHNHTEQCLTGGLRLLKLLFGHTSVSSTVTVPSDVSPLFIGVVQDAIALLTDDGLSAVVHCTLKLLDLGSFKDPILIYDLLVDLWGTNNQLEVNRLTLPLLPSLILHPVVVQAALNQGQLNARIEEILWAMRASTGSRPYMFPALAKAIRHLAFSEPQLLCGWSVVEDLIFDLVQDPPKANPVFIMELAMASKLAELRPTSPHIQKYKDRASLAWACILDAFITNEASVECFRRRIFDRLLEPWPRQKPNAPIVSKWKSTFQLQLLLLVSPTFHDPLESEIYLRKVLYTLSIEPVPRYRFLLEWIVVRIVLGHPAHQQSMVDLIPAFDHSNPKYIVSLLKIALTQLPRAEEDYAFALMKKVVPLSASAKVVVRHEAHWSIPLIWRHATEKNWRSILDDAILRELHAYTVGIRKHSESAKTRPLQDFDPEESYTLTGVFQGEYLRLDPPEKEIVTRDDFLAVRQIDGHLTARRERRLPLGEPLRRAEVSISLDESSVNVESSEPQTRGAGPLQTKSNSWSASSLLTSLPSRADHPPPHPLIVIGSLLTDAHNLGGLSRVSEIFGVATLYVNSVSVLKTTAFTSVAVSSEHWLAIEELPIKEIPASLRERRKEGYVVIGLEQTDRSIVLGGGGERTRRERNGEEADHDEKKPWRFPRRTVLVLGNEREGIPAPLLADLDECVMVRQWGRTRSMNVQTAAAVALYEYTRQHG